MGAALLALGVLLALASAFDGASAGVLAWLAQVPAALGIARLRGSRAHRSLQRDAGTLAITWAGGFLLAAVLVAWPLYRLLTAPSLLPVIALSLAAGLVLVLLWFQWPALQALERDGRGLRVGGAAQDAQDRQSWRGLLQVALPVFLLLALGIALA